MSETGNNKTRLASIISSIASLLVVVIVVPWGTWVTVTLFKLAEQQTVLTEWKNQAPRYTQKDAENLRLQIMTDIKDWFGSRMDRFDTKVDTANRKLDDAIQIFIRHVQEGNSKPQGYYWQPGILLTNSIWPRLSVVTNLSAADAGKLLQARLNERDARP